MSRLGVALALWTVVAGAFPLLYSFVTESTRRERRERAAIAVQFAGLGGLVAFENVGDGWSEWLSYLLLGVALVGLVATAAIHFGTEGESGAAGDGGSTADDGSG